MTGRDHPLAAEKARAKGVTLGRPQIDDATEGKIRRLLDKGYGMLKVAEMAGVGTGPYSGLLVSDKQQASSPQGSAPFLLFG